MCVCVCAPPLQFIRRHIYHTFTQVTTLCSKLCYLNIKLRNLSQKQRWKGVQNSDTKWVASPWNPKTFSALSPHGASARSRPVPPNSWGFKIILSYKYHISIGILWTSDQTVAETSTLYNIQHSQDTDIHAIDRIRTRNPSKRVAANPRLRPRGRRDPIPLLC